MVTTTMTTTVVLVIMKMMTTTMAMTIISYNGIHSSISTEWLFICWNPSYWCIRYRTGHQHQGDSPTLFEKCWGFFKVPRLYHSSLVFVAVYSRCILLSCYVFRSSQYDTSGILTITQESEQEGRPVVLSWQCWSQGNHEKERYCTHNIHALMCLMWSLYHHICFASEPFCWTCTF